MWRLTSLVLLTLLLCASAFGQSTTVSGTIVDSPDGQVWFGGTYSLVFRVSPTSPTGAYFWQGAPFSTQQTIAGALDGSGHYSVSIPSNTAITPAGSTWDLTLCPLATSPCFTVQKITITGGTQTVAPAPPSVRINMGSPAPNTRAYRDGELVAGSLGQTYFNVTDGLVHVCNLVPCTVWNPIGGVINVAVAPTGACTLGSIPEQVISTGVIYTCQASVWAPIASSASAAGSPGQYQLNSGGVLGIGGLSESGGSVTNALDFTNRGPNPRGVDIRFFGAVAANPNSGILTTGSITTGTNSLVVAGTGSFAKGVGIAVVGAGTTHSMVTPAAPTVTPSCAASSTGMDYTVPAGAGSTAYQYQLSLRNPSQGLTAASTAGTTSTGNASLGANNLTITSISAGTGQQKTITFSGSTANLAAGCLLIIGGTSDDGEYGGEQIIDGVPDGTHATYTNGTDVAHGISTTTATGGTGFYFLANHITVPAPNADGHQYLVYGRTSGSNVYLGATKIINLGYTDATYLSWDDYGPTMMASPPTAWWIPTTPPALAVPNTLSTTITGISGTTFTLANNASNTATTQAVRLDNVPNMQAAAAATGFVTNGGGGTIVIPTFENAAGSFCWITSTYLQLTVKAVIQDGPVCAADTIQPGGTWSGTYLDGPRLVLPQFGSVARIPITSQGANPVMLMKGGGSLNNLTISLNGNGGIGVFKVADGGSFPYENLNLASGGSGDYMSVPWYDYQDKTNGSFGGVMNNILCTTGPTQTTGSTMTPCMAFKYNNQWAISNVTQNRRGGFIVPFTGMGYDISMTGDSQGLITPMWTVSQEISGNVPGYLKLHSPFPDTTAFPLVSNLSPASGSIGFSVLIDGYNIPSSNGPLVSGKTFTSGITLQNGVLQAGNEKNVGQNVSVNWIGGNSGNNPGMYLTALRQMVVHYSGNHTTLKNEAAVVSDATGTITIDCTINGAVWDVYSQAGTTTVAPSAGCTLYANGTTGSFTLANSQGVRIQVDNQGGAARASGGVGGGGGGSPGGTVNAVQMNNGAGGFSAANSQTTNGIYVFSENVTSGSSTAGAYTLPGVPFNPQVGTTYTIGAANTWNDRATVITATNSAAQTYTAVNPSTAGFGLNMPYVLWNRGTASGLLTETTSGFKMNNVLNASLSVPINWVAHHWSDGVDLYAAVVPTALAFPVCPDSGGNHYNNDANGNIVCGTSASGNGLSGMTAGQIPVAATATSVTSSKALAGSGTGIVTGPTTSVSTDLVDYTGTGGQTADSGVLLANVWRKDAANISAAVNHDFSAATWKWPTAAGFTASATSMSGYDSTAKIPHCYVNNADGLCATTTTTSTTVTQVLHATAVAGIYAPGPVVTADLPAQYTKFECSPGLGDGLNAITAGTYLQFNCVNKSGVTWTITGISCWTDNAGTSTLNAANNAATSLLTGAVTCNNTKSGGGAAGTQSGTTTLANNDAISFTFVADGTSKQTTWTVSLSQ